MNGRSPYPGLRPFRRDESDLFFGREEQVDQMLERLDRSHFLAVVGTSGCGKSSLVKAGMIAALEAGFMVSAGTHWRIAEMRPGDHPMKSLTEALLTNSALVAERREDASTRAFLYAALRRGPLGLLQILQETPLPPKTNLLLLVDQFEEIFRFRKRSDEDEDDAFISLLLATASQKEIPVYVVITMRSDYLGDCARFSGLAEAMNDNQFLTPAMTREQRRAAIEAPARVFGDRVEGALVNQILNDMGPDPAQLPLMQHLLMRMWTCAGRTMETAGDQSPDAPKKTLSLTDYEDAGGLVEALSKHADEVYGELDDQQKRICEVVFRCLSERSVDRRDTRRPTALGEVAEVATVPWEKAAAVANAFRGADRSFLMPPFEVPLTPDKVLDISHESLIRCWKRLNLWVDKEAESAEYYLFLSQSAKRWKRGEAGLWTGSQLNKALRWKQRQNPTGAWSRRYGADFDQVVEFLEESELRWKEAQQAEKKRAQSEIKQKILLEAAKKSRQKLVIFCISLAVLTFIIGLFYYEKKTAQEELEKLFVVNEALRSADVSKSEYRKDEQAALWARQAFFFSPEEKPERLNRVDKNLRTVLDLPHFNHILSSGIIVNTLAISADNRWLAAGGVDTDVRLWDLTKRQIEPIPLKSNVKEVNSKEVNSVTFSADNRWLASAGRDGVQLWEVQLWDTKNGLLEPVRLKNHEGQELFSVAFSRNGRIAAAQADGKVKMWHVESLSADPELCGAHDGPAYAVAFSQDGRWLASGGEDKMVKLWDVQNPSSPCIFVKQLPHEHAVFTVAFSPDGGFLASAGHDRDVRLWNVEKFENIENIKPELLEGSANVVKSLAFSKDGRLLAAAGGSAEKDKLVLLWDLKDGKKKRTDLRGHYQNINSVVFSADGQFLASAGQDKDVRLWEMTRQQLSSILLVGKGLKAAAFAFDPKGAELASAGENGTVLLWNFEAHLEVRDVLKREKHALQVDAVAYSPQDRWLVDTVAYSPEGRWLASARSMTKNSGLPEWEVCIWDLEKRTESRVRRGVGGQVLAMVFSSDGRRLVTADSSGSVRLWDESGLSPNWTESEAHTGPVYSVAFSPNGLWLASGGSDKTVKLWNLQNRSGPPAPLEVNTHQNAVMAVAFSPDSRFLASASSDKITLWDLQKKQVIPYEFSGHEGDIFSLIFRDNERLAAAGYDNRVWECKFTRPTKNWISRELGGFTDKSVFSPHGRWLATRSLDSVTLHLLETEELAESVCNKVWFNLSDKEWKQIFVGEIERPYEKCKDLPTKPDK